MKTLSVHEAYFTSGPFGNGIHLNQDFEQFQDGMIDMLYKVTGKNLKHTPLSDTAAGRIAIAGTCIMSAAAISKYSNGKDKVLEITNATIDALNKFGIDEIKLNTIPGINLLNANDQSQSSPLLRLIISRFEQNLADSGVKTKIITSPASLETQNEIEKAMDILKVYIPDLTFDVLPGISAVLPISTGVESAFVSPTPLLIYIDPKQFSGPLDLADALFHEALHQKLLIIRLTKRLLRPGYDDFKGMAVPIPWGSQKYRMFSTGRALAAAHVYVHLTLLYAAALTSTQEFENGETTIESSFRTRYDRASYLVETLLMKHYRHEFGVDGLEFLDWLKQGLLQITKIDHIKATLEQHKKSSVG